MKPAFGWFLILAVIVFSAQAFSADKPLAVYAGTVVSNNPQFEAKTLLEVPFSINRNELEFIKIDSTDPRYFSRVYAQLDIISTAGLTIDSVRTYFSVATTSLDEVQAVEMRIFNKLAISLYPGLYSARLTVIDVVSKRTGEFYFPEINVVPTTTSLGIGGLSMAYSVRYVGEEGKETNPHMYKNGFIVLNNPLNLVTDQDTLTYFFGEVYNLKYDPNNTKSLLLTVNVLDNNKVFLSSMGSRKIELAGSSAVITEAIDLTSFAIGHYNFEIIATDMIAQKADTSYLPLHIVNTAQVLAEARKVYYASNDPYDTLSLKDKSNLVHYLLNDNEMRIFNSLGDSAKLNFLAQYWKEHDIDPSTTLIENRIEFIRRYNFCNMYFSNNDTKTNGWISDRGRIYMTYGPYDQIDDIQSPRIGDPYQIWEYNHLTSGNMFVFEDWSGNDDYRLVHSNVYGEVYSKDWEERIKMGDAQFLDQ